MKAPEYTHTIESDLPQPVRSAIADHRIVLVASPITDLGLITRWLAQRGLDYCRVELSMRSPESRADYEQLRRATRWRSLPQIFIDGNFIGGTEQFFDTLAGDAAATPANADVSPWARGLGYAGLIPFMALALLALIAQETVAAWAIHALMAYGAVILSFIGALHWTRGLDADDARTATRLLAVSVLPALLGWIALLLPMHSGLAVLAVGFVLVYAYDRQAWQWRPAFLSLRTHLTAGAVGSLVVVWLGGAA